MTYSIVFSSKTGNTKMLAEKIKSVLPEKDCVYFGAPDSKALEADRIYAGFWTDKGTCDKDASEFLKLTGGKEVFLFGTAGFGGSSEYFDKVLGEAKKHLPESASYIGGFMCQGKMPMAVRQRYEKMLEQPNHMPNLESMIENFDKALSHPDENDLDRLLFSLKAFLN